MNIGALLPLAFMLGPVLLPAGPKAGLPTASVPFVLDHNRMIVEVEFVRRDGSIRKSRAWVDTGNPVLSLNEPLARDLGLDLSGPPEGKDQATVILASAPVMRLGGRPLGSRAMKARVSLGAPGFPGVPVEANLPSTAFLGCRVVFDYPARLLTVSSPGAASPRGTAVPCRVNPETGIFQVAASVDGRAIELAVDMGSSSTWVSSALTTEWQTRHPDRPASIGAVGTTNFFGFGFEAQGRLLRLPELGIGAVRAFDAAVLGLDPRLFEWYSKKAAGRVDGFVGANVLRHFRLEVDLAAGMSYWEAGDRPDPHDLDIVGLTLKPEGDGRFTIAGIGRKDGKPCVEGVEAGDTLIRVDELDVAKASMGAVADSLRGAPGAKRVLLLERAGRRFRVEAIVVRFP
jgi:hypothetical protein